MTSKDQHRIALLKKVLAFVDRAPAEIAQISPGYAVQVQTLRQVIAIIDTVSNEREVTPLTVLTRQHRLARTVLYEQLKRIRRVAQFLERTVSGMPRLVHLPQRSANEQLVLDAARAAIRDTAPYQDAFTSGGLAADFLERLQVAIAAVERARNAKASVLLHHKIVQGQITYALRAGTDAMTCLDGIVREACMTGLVPVHATLTLWKRAISPRHLRPRPERANP